MSCLPGNSSIDQPLVTIAVPSLNQAKFLDEALKSLFQQDIPIEVMVADGGSTDGSLEIIQCWSPRLQWWRSHPDKGQPSAINEAISKGKAPYVCWLNADDILLPGGLKTLVKNLDDNPDTDIVYGRCWKLFTENGYRKPYWTSLFSKRALSVRCFIAQPATLIRRTAWESAGGVDESLPLAFDYDLWWRLYKTGRTFRYIQDYVASMSMHLDMKTTRLRRVHCLEAMQVVKKHYGRIPLKWYLVWPVRVTAWRVFWKLG